MSKPAHHNCKVTGPAIFGSHPLNRLQGYDLNSPSDILKDEEGGHYTSRSRSSPSGYSVNNNNNNNNNNSGQDAEGEKDSISLKPLHFCGPVDYVKKSSTLEYPMSLNGFSLKKNQHHPHHHPHHGPLMTGYHSPSGYKSFPGAGRFVVNDAWMLLPHVTCSSNDHRRTSLSSRASCNSYERSGRRHSCPPRQPLIHLAPGVTNVPPYIYHGPEHGLPFGLPPNCLRCATLTRDGSLHGSLHGSVPVAENVGFFPVTSDEIEYRATSSKKNQATSPRRGSSASPLSAAESADSNSSHNGGSSARQSSATSTCKSGGMSSKSHNPVNSPSPTKATRTSATGHNMKNKSSVTISSCSKDASYYSTDAEVTDTKL